MPQPSAAVEEWSGEGWCPQCTRGWAPRPGDRFEVVYRRRGRPTSLFCPRAGHDVTAAVAALPAPRDAPAGAVPTAIRRSARLQ